MVDYLKLKLAIEPPHRCWEPTEPGFSERVASVPKCRVLSSSCIKVVLTESSVCGFSCNSYILQGLITTKWKFHSRISIILVLLFD